MTQHPSDTEMSWQQNQQPAKPKKGWFGRNWWWVLLLAIGLPLLCCGGIIFAVYSAVNMGLEELAKMPPYKDTIVLVEQDPTVQQEVGTPIDWPEGFTDLINVEQQGGSIDLQSVNGDMLYNARLPVSGPNGSGTLRVEAESIDGVSWTYTVREFEIDSTGEVIDLLPPDSNNP